MFDPKSIVQVWYISTQVEDKYNGHCKIPLKLVEVFSINVACFSMAGNWHEHSNHNSQPPLSYFSSWDTHQDVAC